MNFTFCGAIAARRIIESCYDQAIHGFLMSVREMNGKRINYWLERIGHLLIELNKIERVIEELEAEAGELTAYNIT